MALTARVLHRTVNGLGNSVPVRPEQSEAAQLRDELQVVCNSLAWFEELGDVYSASAKYPPASALCAGWI